MFVCMSVCNRNIYQTFRSNLRTICTQVFWRRISVKISNGQNLFNNFKMVAIVNTWRTISLERVIMFENKSHQMKAGKKLCLINSHKPINTHKLCLVNKKKKLFPLPNAVRSSFNVTNKSTPSVYKYICNFCYPIHICNFN